MIIGDRIKIARLARGITQAELGQRIRLSFKHASSTICQYENGKHEPSYNVVKKIARALTFPTVFF